jgi:hypothetical protein
MNRVVVIAFIVLFLTSLVSASDLSDFFSDANTRLNLTITQSDLTANFYLNTAGLSWNRQTLLLDEENKYPFYISSLLNDLDFKISLNHGSSSPTISILNLYDDEAHDTLFPILSASETFIAEEYGMDISFEEVKNGNLSGLHDLIQKNPFPQPMQGNAYLEKNGNNYIYWMDSGYGDVPSEYQEKIAEAIETAVHSMNIQKVLDEYIFPYTDFEAGVDLDYDVSADLSNLKYENGDYNIPVKIQQGSESVTKNIKIILSGINFVKETYVPPADEKPEVKEIIEEITGLNPGTTITIQVKEETDVNLTKPIPVKLDAIKVLEITTNQETTAALTFRIDKTSGIDPNKVHLYVWETASSYWRELTTTYTGSGADYYEYIAVIPHFSLFMIAEDTGVTSSGGAHKDNDDTSDDETNNDAIVCITGDIRCNGNIVQLCSYNKWVDGNICENGCSNGACILANFAEINPLKNIDDNPKTAFRGLTGAVVGFLGSGVGVFTMITFAIVALGLVIVLVNKRFRK